ncbi:hypothetical protein BDZ89DRAFT_1073097 [Hymenopellis radicata]|nr:hypothetical protein BDZ89DRAFT_1073097 [Hymenopellis radicata]
MFEEHPGSLDLIFNLPMPTVFMRTRRNIIQHPPVHYFGLSADDAEQLIGSLLNSDVIEIVCYTLYTMIFGLTMRQTVSRGEWPIERIVLTSVLCVIWVFATAYVALIWATLYIYFVSHGQSRESFLDYFFCARLKILAIQLTFTAVNAMFADLVNIWRCWVLYDRSMAAVVLPMLGVVCGLISHAFRTVTLLSSRSSQTLANTNWFIVYCSVTAATNILTTSLIIYRILSFTGLRGARTYRGIIEIFIESAFLYSATYVVYVAIDVYDFYAPYWAFGNLYVAAFVNSVTATAPTLIVGRVMAGETRLNDSWLHTLPHIPTTTVQSTAGGLPFASLDPHITAATVDLPAHDNDCESQTSAAHRSDAESSKPNMDTVSADVQVEAVEKGLDGNQNC